MQELLYQIIPTVNAAFYLLAGAGIFYLGTRVKK